MATYRHTFRWRPLGGVTITHAQLRSLHLPEDCWLDGVGLQSDGSFRSLCLSWPGRFGEEFRTVAEAMVLEWWDQVKGRRAPAAPFPRREVQALLRRALAELEGEFSDLIRERVASVMGDSGARSRPAPSTSANAPLPARPSTRRRRRRRPKASPARSAPEPTTTTQARLEERAHVRAAVLAALGDGRARARGDLLGVAGLFESDVPVLIHVLRGLIAEGLVKKVGRRGGSRYSVTGD